MKPASCDFLPLPPLYRITMAPIMVIRNTFVDLVDDTGRKDSHRRSSSAPGRLRSKPSFTVRIASRQRTERTWPFSQTSTDELLRSLERVSKRLVPSHGHQTQRVGNRMKSCWPRDPPSSATVELEFPCSRPASLVFLFLLQRSMGQDVVAPCKVMATV